MQDGIEAFLLALEARGRSQRTIATYRQRLGFLEDAVGKRTLEMSAEDLDRYIVDLREHGLSPVTIFTRTQTIKTYFTWCVERGYLDQSPARHLKMRRPQRMCSEPMEKGNLQLLLAAAKEWAEERGEPRDMAIIRFFADTGCRSGELCSLKMNNLFLEKRTASVNGKTGDRWVDFTEATAQAIEAWLRVRPETNSPNVFIGYRTRSALTTGAVYRIFYRHAVRAGITEGRYNPHAVRHLVGQEWLDNGANLELVKEKLGHSDIGVTSLFYSHQDRKRLKAATERFSLLKGLE